MEQNAVILKTIIELKLKEILEVGATNTETKEKIKNLILMLNQMTNKTFIINKNGTLEEVERA